MICLVYFDKMFDSVLKIWLINPYHGGDTYMLKNIVLALVATLALCGLRGPKW